MKLQTSCSGNSQVYQRTTRSTAFSAFPHHITNLNTICRRRHSALSYVIIACSAMENFWLSNTESWSASLRAWSCGVTFKITLKASFAEILKFSAPSLFKKPDLPRNKEFFSNYHRKAPATIFVSRDGIPFKKLVKNIVVELWNTLYLIDRNCFSV